VTAPMVVAFNTGRCYTAAGQRIAAMFDPGGEGGLLMVDVDRGIDYFLPAEQLPESFELTPEWVLRAYDYSKGWRCATEYGHPAVRGLRVAARAVAAGCR